MILLTTRTADWFEQRGFKPDGPAHESLLLPESRRKQVSARCRTNLGCAVLTSLFPLTRCMLSQIDATRGSLIYAKEINGHSSDAASPR